MTDWEPATEAEAAMRDALRAHDQELYFRILARTDLLLPVSAEALAGQAPMGWGTWTTNGRTHVLAFTSEAALRACLGGSNGSSRRCAYHDLASGWPNHEWWLAVNPGLPIEGYLPAWFVSQLSRGDVRLPGRTLGARARLEQVEQLARSRAAGAEAPAPEPSRPSPPASPLSPPASPLSPPASPLSPPASPLSPAAPPLSPPVAPLSPAAPPEPARPSSPAPPYGANRPSAATPPRRGVPDQSGAATEPPRAAPPDPRGVPESPPSGGTAEPASNWLTNPRRASRPEPGPTPPANGQSAGTTGRNSYFEPAPPGRSAGPAPISPLRQERAVPPSRLGEPGRAFPRRRPYRPEPTGNEPTRAFQFTDSAPAPTEQPATPSNRFPSGPPAAEPTQTLPRRQPLQDPVVGDQTQALPRRMPTPQSGESTQPLPRRVPPDAGESVAPEPTQPIPYAGPPDAADPPPLTEPTGYAGPEGGYAGSESHVGYAGPEPAGYAGPEPAGYAGPEPATGYAGSEPATEPAGYTEPEPARSPSPSPLVIEGTVVESRDLVDPASAYRTGPDVGASYPPGTADQPSQPTTSRHDPAPAGYEPAGYDPATAGYERAGYEPATAVYEPAPAAYGAFASPYEAAGSGQETAGTGFGAAVPEHQPVAAQSPEPGYGSASPSGTEPLDAPGAGSPASTSPAVDFDPANDVEEELLDAAGTGSTDTFLSTLLLARVLLPVAPDSSPGARPGESGFVWRTEQLDGEPYVVVYTSPERLADHVVTTVETVQVKFVQLIRRWPDEQWSFAVNPGTPVGAKLPGEQIVALANWAAEVGLGDDVEPEPVEPVATPTAEEPETPTRYATTPEDPNRPPMMQKAVAPSQLAYYLERGYDRVSGFVHRAGEVAHLNTPARLHAALGLCYPGSPFSPDADEIYVLRWPAYRPSLYRIPYGGQNESAMRAMEGWVIERPPFRGNGFAPGESSDVVAEFKVDSARLPHGAQLWRIGADGSERVVATLDTDALHWRQVGEL
ncbi:SseB family protein [Micromonospora pallida]|uniref:SseB family protein n=1 Tax=Micromonospora pallida TaxID=145854 RepID=UPI000B809BC9|nr:SseB family protein [Micromonospora pallida]